MRNAIPTIAPVDLDVEKSPFHYDDRMTEDANGEYTTSDFYVTAFLLALGHKISHINRDNPKRVFFAFNDFDGREDLVRSFLYGEAQVGAQVFVAAIKTLKGLIHSDD